MEMQEVADDDSENFTEMTGSRTAALQPATTWVDSSGEHGSRVDGIELEMIEEENGADEGAVGLANIPEDERPAVVLALEAAAEAKPAQPMCLLCSSVLQVEPAGGLGKDGECPTCLKICDSDGCYHCATCCSVFCLSCQMSEEQRKELCEVVMSEVVRLLIEKGADATAEDEDKKTPMHLAAFNGHVEVVRRLIEKGADATAEDKDKKIPLHLAAENGHLEVVRLLIEKGADATAEDKDKKTPVHLAAFNGHLDIVRLLIEKSADATAEDKDKIPR